MVEKAIDAGTMFWQALDERERMLMLYGVAWLAITALSALREREQRQREDKLVTRIVGELHGSHV